MSRSELDSIDHVLRGGLNTALLNLQLLSASVAADTPAAALIERARAEIRRLAEVLLPAALQIVALEIVRAEPVNLRQLAEAVSADPELGALVLVPGPCPHGRGDPDLLALALRHLARNAVAASPEAGPPPRIAIEAGSNEVAFRVTNACGDGLPVVTAGSIAGRRGHLGGVVVAARIARLHGGTLRYETADGQLAARLTIPGVGGEASGGA